MEKTLNVIAFLPRPFTKEEPKGTSKPMADALDAVSRAKTDPDYIILTREAYLLNCSVLLYRAMENIGQLALTLKLAGEENLKEKVHQLTIVGEQIAHEIQMQANPGGKTPPRQSA